MAVFYLDTSAILKRYRTESGSPTVDDLYDRQGAHDTLLTSLKLAGISISESRDRR